MRIAFCNIDSYWGGLANNGGSRTILLSCEHLRRLGHTADIVSPVDKFTWFKHPRPLKKIPKDADVLVAVAISDVKHVMKAANGRTMAYWARPAETWQYSKEKCERRLKKFVAAGGIVMVNSGWQLEYWSERDIDTTVVWAGMDFELYEPGTSEQRGRESTIAAQYSTKPRKGCDHVLALMLKLGRKLYRYTGFGSENAPDYWVRYTKNASSSQVRKIYRSAKYFLCPNTLEGWYNCAAEAALCGCTLVVRDSRSNGSSDFVTRENSIVYQTIDEAASRIRAGEAGDNQDVVRRLKQTGSREQCMQRMVEVLS